MASPCSPPSPCGIECVTRIVLPQIFRREPSTCLSPVNIVLREMSNGCQGSLGVQAAQSLENVCDAFTSRPGGKFEQVRLPLMTFWPFLAPPLNKCGFTPYDILAFFGPKYAFLLVLSVFLVENRHLGPNTLFFWF